jgi:hypothetical protein
MVGYVGAIWGVLDYDLNLFGRKVVQKTEIALSGASGDNRARLLRGGPQWENHRR